MTTAELMLALGAPAVTANRIQRERGDGLVETMWPDPRDPSLWWWAIARGGVVIALGRAAVEDRDRDIEIGRAIAATLGGRRDAAELSDEVLS